ncbi:MAG TPA: cation diffusion facilitator family transporter [Dehalococcoidia bacterium]|nr:cation diffusion facilitator family transporter [Dehalococcoidia bacterium]
MASRANFVHDDHAHSAAEAGAGRLRLVLILTAAYMIVEVVGGFATGSLALIADAGHMFTDVAGVSMALFAIKLASRPATTQKTYGYYRLEILAALANGMLLIAVAVYILFEASRRFSGTHDVMGWPMLGVATLGLVVNLASAYLLFEGQKTSLNVKAAFLEVISDLLGSVAVIVAGIVILTTGFDLIDPIASVFIGIFILPRTWHLMSEAAHVLLEGAPRNVNIEHIREHILGARDVVGLHDLHVWSMTSGMPVMSAHVVVADEARPGDVLDELCECLQEHFDIEHSTIQIERADRSAREHAAH